MISKVEIQKIANLARIELTDLETEKLQKDLSAILDYFNVLQTAPSVSAMSDFAGKNVLRKDIASSNYALAGDLVQAAPDKKDGYIKVKAVL